MPATAAVAGITAFDPARIITHRMPLSDAPTGFEIFENKKDNCEKVVLKT